MTTEPNLAKIVDKLHKLKALADNPGQGGENVARLALEKMQEIMADNNLTMAQIEASGGNAGQDAKRTKDAVNHRTVYKWQRALMASIAELNSCHCTLRFEDCGFRKPAIFNGYELIGREVNVAATRVMFGYLVSAIERVARDHVNNDPAQYFTKYAHSFKEGCSDRLVERLQEKREAMLAEQEAKAREEQARQRHPAAATSNALVVVMRDFYATEEDLNNDFRRGWEPGTTAKRRADNERRMAEQEAAAAAKLATGIARIQANEPGIDPELAELLAKGWNRTQAEIYLGIRVAPPAPEQKPETEAQRRKREEREANQERRYWARREREQSRLDSRGYNAGNSAGADISLDKQIDKRNQEKLS